MKQAQKAQGSTQDSLRAAVSALDKQVQVLPSNLAKQLAQPAEDALPKTKSEAALQRQPTQVQPVADVFDKQLNQWTGVLDQVHPDDNEPAHVRLARLDKQQQQQVPLTRQLIVEPTAPAVQPQQAQQAQQQPPAVPPPAELTPPAPVIVQVLFCMVHTVQLFAPSLRLHLWILICVVICPHSRLAKACLRERSVPAHHIRPAVSSVPIMHIISMLSSALRQLMHASV